MTPGQPVLEAVGIAKEYGSVRALSGVDIRVFPGRVTCLLGDNGAGKSTLIKILAGVVRPDVGTLQVDGEAVTFRSPAEALDRGVATVYQDLALVPIMSVYRNFFIGREPCKGWGPLRRLDVRFAKRVAHEQLRRVGVDLDDVTRPVESLSGGQRQAVAIAKAVYFGARVLILDEPTSALGVREAGMVLRYIGEARKQGIGIVLVTHNTHHAHAVGDHFVVLKRGAVLGSFNAGEVTVEELSTLMAGGAEELERLAERASTPDGPHLLHEHDVLGGHGA
ncbi:MAG TPA: ATP-binding cassette domain-containing protein [Conexibacter sp.]|nr:ATP-binding cassette domain-containing protein [Conexibacter sp.]